MAAAIPHKAKTMWDHLKQITATQDPRYWETLSDADHKSWSTFMIMRFLSMNSDWVTVINDLQPFVERLDPPVVYELLIGILPKSKIFLNYVKANKPKHEYEDWLVHLVRREFECDSTQAVDYIDILRTINDGESIRIICQKYGTSEEQLEALEL